MSVREKGAVRLDPDDYRYFRAMQQRRWPFPLPRWTIEQMNAGEPKPEGYFTHEEIAAMVGVHRRQVTRWITAGLPDVWADALAAKVLGLHPAFVWPDYLAHSMEYAAFCDEHGIEDGTVVRARKHPYIDRWAKEDA